MAQNIGIIKINEKGELLAKCEVNFVDILKNLGNYINFSDLPFLSSIDEYGNTYFNRIQIPHLVAEMERFRKVFNMSGPLEQVIAFISKVGIHEYIQFIGD